MARHFVTWFLATLVLAHVCAQMQQTSSSISAAPKGWLSSLFLLGARARRKQSTSYPSSLLLRGPCTINGTLYPTPTLPQLFIVGAQKSGTTALASILAHHEQIEAPRHRSAEGDVDVVTEGHFFDFHYRTLVDQSSYLADRDEQTCWLRNRYAAQYRRSLLSGDGARKEGLGHAADQRRVKQVVHLEKSPSYLISPHVPDAVHRLVPDAHVLVLLRNPVHRLLSHYRMMTTQQQAKERVNADVFDAGNSTGRSLKVNRGNLRRRQRLYQEEEPSLANLESILNQELRLLQHPVRTYLSSVNHGDRTGTVTAQQHQANFDIPASPAVGSATYDAYYRWDDLARTPSTYRGFDRLLQRGMYSVQLERWMYALDGSERSRNDKNDGRRKGRQRRKQPLPANLIVLPYELFESHPQAVLDHLFRRLKVEKWTVPASVLRARYDASASGRSDAAWSSSSSNSSRAAHDHRRDPSAAAAAAAAATTAAVTPELMAFLYRFYRPHNDRLADLLGEQWRGIWDMPVAVAPAPGSSTPKPKDGSPGTHGAESESESGAASLPLVGDDVDGEAGDEAGADDNNDDDDAIDSDPHAWKRVWLEKILRE
jgi:Sulfotransferase family